MQVPIKGDYYKRDFPRSARCLDVAYRQPTAFPINALAPSRAFYWLDQFTAKRALAAHTGHASRSEINIVRRVQAPNCGPGQALPRSRPN